MESLYEEARESVSQYIEGYRLHIVDEIATIFSFSDEVYAQWYMELKGWEDEMLDRLDEEQEDEFLPTPEKIASELVETYIENVVRGVDEQEVDV